VVGVPALKRSTLKPIPSKRLHLVPPISGFRFGLFSIPPDNEERPGDLDVAAALADMEEGMPGMLRYMDTSDPGMHTTDTIDFEIVLEGTVTLELDDGATGLRACCKSA